MGCCDSYQWSRAPLAGSRLEECAPGRGPSLVMASVSSLGSCNREPSPMIPDRKRNIGQMQLRPVLAAVYLALGGRQKERKMCDVLA